MRKSLFLVLLFYTLAVCPSAFAGSKIRISAINVIDDGSYINAAAIPLVDTVQGECGTLEEPQPEPFFDSVANIQIHNRTRTNLRFTSLSYTFGQGGSTFKSNEIAPGNSFDVPPGKTGTFVASLFLRVQNGRKYFVGSDTPISEWTGPIAIKFTLTGKNGRKNPVSASATTTVSFSNYNRCPSN